MYDNNITITEISDYNADMLEMQNDDWFPTEEELEEMMVDSLLHDIVRAFYIDLREIDLRKKTSNWSSVRIIKFDGDFHSAEEFRKRWNEHNTGMVSPVGTFRYRKGTYVYDTDRKNWYHLETEINKMQSLIEDLKEVL